MHVTLNEMRQPYPDTNGNADYRMCTGLPLVAHLTELFLLHQGTNASQKWVAPHPYLIGYSGTGIFKVCDQLASTDVPMADLGYQMSMNEQTAWLMRSTFHVWTGSSSQVQALVLSDLEQTSKWTPTGATTDDQDGRGLCTEALLRVGLEVSTLPRTCSSPNCTVLVKNSE
jgi:hypothetical protein